MSANAYNFLNPNNQITTIIRTTDWTKTSLGNVENWPQSLRTSLSIVLNSAQPTLLFWGNENYCFFNEAFYSETGNSAKIGAIGNDAIPKIWDSIQSSIVKISSGEEIHLEASSIAISNSGLTKHCKFIFTAVHDETGKVGGVLVNCSQADANRFQNIVKQVPLGITILNGRDFVPEMANENYLQLVDRTEEEFVGRPLFDSLPEVRDVVEPLLNGVMDTGVPFHASDLSVILNRYGKEETAYFNLVYYPMKEDNGTISGVIVVASEVTESVKAQQFLAESEKQFRNLVMQSPIAMTILKGDDYVIEIANEVLFKNIWRKKEEDVLGRSILEVFPELRDQKYPELLELVYRTGHTHREEEAMADVEGDDGMRRFYLDFEYSPLFETDGTISGIMITVNDVTEKVIAKQTLFDAEERLRLATEATELSTWDLDLKTREVIHSPRHAEIFGYDRNQKIRHQDMRDQVLREDIGIVERAFELALQTGIYRYEARIMKPDFQVSWIRTQGKVIYDRNKKPIKMLGTVRDITEEKLRQQDLLESESKFRLLSNSLPQLIWITDIEGHNNYFNHSVFEYTGLNYEQLNGEGWMTFVHPDDREQNKKLWSEALKTGNDFVFEHRLRKHDGEYRWQLSHAVPHRDESGNIQMWVGTSTDIQDQKTFTDELERLVQQRTQELELRNEDLRKINTELQSFAYVSSHDLQEPLRKIQIFAGRVMEKEYDKLSDSAKDYFDRMQKAAKRMQTLIRDLLAYSRTNTTDEDFVTIDLHDVIVETLGEFRERIDETHAKIEINGTCHASVIVFQFRQLMHNLIGNALKFSIPGKAPKITIDCKIGTAKEFGLEVSEDKPFTEIRISDNGIGFDAEYQEQIFEVFKRLHGREEYSGTGIGLAIVKKIVDFHKGFVFAEGKKNLGATFRIYLPV